MALSLSPLFCHLRHYHHRFSTYGDVQRPHRRDSLHYNSNPKVSLSVSSLSEQNHYTPPDILVPELSLLVNNLCQSHKLNEALHLLEECSNDANTQKAEAIGILLQACGQHKDVETGRKLHEIVSTHFSNNFVLNTRLITMYSMCGLPLESRVVFDQLKAKNLYVWNAIISGYTRNELNKEAILMLCDLISGADLKPDNFTLPCAIKASAGLLEVGIGETIHGFAVKVGLASDVYVGNSLISMYGKCGFVEETVEVFEKMPERNLVSWNSMIRGYSENGFYQESVDVFMQLIVGEANLIPDVASVVTILPVIAREGDVEMGMMIHGMTVKLGLDQELNVTNSLLDMYAKCGFLTEAQTLFDRNAKKNVVSWNSMLGNYSREGDASKTYDLLRKMQMEGGEIMVDEVTILNVLPACTEKSELMRLKELHGYSLRCGFHYDELVSNAFIAAYAKCGFLSSADRVFRSMETKSVNTWNALIGGHAQNGDSRESLKLYFEMISSGFFPDWFSIGSLLLACKNLRLLQSGKEIHAFVLRNGLEMDSFISISLLAFYIHCDETHSAQALFDRMENKNQVSWNAIIAGYSQNEHPEEALYAFRQMLCDGIQPHEIATTGLLGACSQLSALQLAREIHCFVLKGHMLDDLFVACSVIDTYAKCGCIEQSRRVFNGLKKRDVASWTVMIAGYGIHGHGDEAMELFEEMQRSVFKPDHFTFISILMACCHAGLVERGLQYFSDMYPLYGIEPKLEHYACIVDMLGRAGRLTEALKLVDEMPEEPDAKIWSSLVSACRTHCDFNLGGEAAEKLLEIEPDRAENYVLVSNLLAQLGKWDEMRTVREKMKELGLQKDAGCSWVEVGGKLYSFTVGDDMLPLSKRTEEMWRRLEDKTIKIELLSDESSVLHDLITGSE